MTSEASSSNQWFDGRVALVTGAGSGIGRASALAFARRGASVVVSDVDEGGGSETVDLIRATGAQATFIRADVSDEADVEAMVRAAESTFGRLDFAHNNAGIGLPRQTPIAEIPAEMFDRILAVNLRGVFLCVKAQVPLLLRQERSAIVVTSSRAGRIGGPGNSPYVATKHAVNGIVKCVALEYAHRGLRINAFGPSYTQTTMTKRHPPELLEHVVRTSPMERPAQPEEMAEVATWLCSPLASYVNGTTLAVDGGLIAAELLPVMTRIHAETQ